MQQFDKNTWVPAADRSLCYPLSCTCAHAPSVLGASSPPLLLPDRLVCTTSPAALMSPASSAGLLKAPIIFSPTTQEHYLPGVFAVTRSAAGQGTGGECFCGWKRISLQCFVTQATLHSFKGRWQRRKELASICEPHKVVIV